MLTAMDVLLKINDAQDISLAHIRSARYEQLVSWKIKIEIFIRDYKLRKKLRRLTALDEFVVLLNKIIQQYKGRLPDLILAKCAQIAAKFLSLRISEFDEITLNTYFSEALIDLESIERDLSANLWVGFESSTRPSAFCKRYLTSIYSANVIQGNFVEYVLPQIISLIQSKVTIFLKNNELYKRYKTIISDVQSVVSMHEFQEKLEFHEKNTLENYPSINEILAQVRSELHSKNILSDSEREIGEVSKLYAEIDARISEIESDNENRLNHVINVAIDQVNADKKPTQQVKNFFEEFKRKIISISVYCDAEELRSYISNVFEEERVLVQNSSAAAQTKQLKTENKKIMSILSNIKAVLIRDQTLFNDYENNQRLLIVQSIRDGIERYQESALFSIGADRVGVDGEGGFKSKLISEIEATKNAYQAARFIRQAIEEVTAHHQGKSILGNVPLIDKESRMARALRSAQEDLENKKLIPKLGDPPFISLIKGYIELYKNEDIFYHNRKRLRKSNQLLLDLLDLNYCDDKDILEKREAIKDKLDFCINSIIKDYEEGFFAKIKKYLFGSESRLVVHLKNARLQLVQSNFIPQYSYQEFVRPIICDHLIILADQLKDSFTLPATDSKQEIEEFNSDLIANISSAATPNAAEAILKASIITLEQEASNTYFDRYRRDFAHRLIGLLNVLQQAGLLTVSSEFAKFLNSTGRQAQEIRADRIKLEVELGMRLPDKPEDMQRYAAHLKLKAEALRGRLLNLRL